MSDTEHAYPPPWSTCREAGDCRGAILDGSSGCFTHASKGDRGKVLATVAAGAPLNFGQGVRFTEERLAELLAALPRDSDGFWIMHRADFRSATLPYLDVDDTRFQGDADFAGARFEGDATFMMARFQDTASFAEARFTGDARFVAATFMGSATFHEAQFHGDAQFLSATFHCDVGFDGASFQQPMEPGLMLVKGSLRLDGIALDHPVQLEVAATALSCRRTRFRAGGHLRLVAAKLRLEEAEMPVPLIVSAHRLDPDWEKGWRELVPGAPSRPQLVSVQRADVAGLVLTDLDLSTCHFAGAHHLDQLRITGADTFWRVATGPFGNGRQVLAEECAWRRRANPQRRRWQTTASLAGHPFLAHAYQPGPAELAWIYRQLRKGREDQKNEPGAADFYYGEMEMRRVALPRWRAERVLLGLYWLVSGYALRAGRALTALALLVAVVAGLFALWGLPAPVSPASGRATITGQPPTQRATFTLPTAVPPAPPRTGLAARLRDPTRVELALRSALSAVVFRDTGQQLTVPGRYTEMVARFLGPVLLALALLSVRNRVKR
jgi:uncharacterized protein YjbI with pentapeptide repeats